MAGCRYMRPARGVACLALATMTFVSAVAQQPAPVARENKPDAGGIVSQEPPFDVEIITDQAGKPITIFKHRAKQIDPPREMTPDPPRTFEPGPPIRPRQPLMEWLDRFIGYETKRSRRVKLPVFFHLDNGHPHIMGAFIGVADTIDAETIFVRLDDSMMGVSLMDRLLQQCPSTYSTCIVWLEGYWGGVSRPAGLRGPSRDKSGIDRTEWPFVPVRVHERIEEGLEGAEVRAQLEVAKP